MKGDDTSPAYISPRDISSLDQKMADRIFREKVYTFKTAGASSDVHDMTGIMQDIAPRKGFKLYAFNWYASTTAACATDDSTVYVNAMKNISEPAHHVDPANDGEYTESSRDGVIFTDLYMFQAATDRITDMFKHEYYEKPLDFDANDRLNLEIDFGNLDAASGSLIVRIFMDVEV